MADKKSQNEAAAQHVDRLFIDNVHNIVPVDLETEMQKSFIDYAMSVITDRALPDVRDGLKPVHRRILYSMFTQGFTPDKPHRKCATTVGDVLGRFHPHGDASVYDALVRLAQDFSMREMLVDGHGNFGSRDGDSPAAYRYTESRLTKIAMEMMSDINKNTVDFRPNFDEHEMEPVVLPAHLPNMLINGSVGIAVGMATNIPPHNLAEVIDGAIHLMHNPDASVEELMEFIKGPDFPTAGNILGTSGIREVYRSGKGRITVRAKAEIEEMDGGRHKIIVNDLPYMVNKARLIERIAEMVKEKRLEGISFIRDESDRKDAVRIVIELKRDANANVVLNQLYKHTQLQDNFNANMLALVPEGNNLIPRQVSLREALNYYLEHQKEVTLRRTRFDLEKAEAREHIVNGLLIAIDNIDEVIRIIRASATEEEAKLRLSERFGFSPRQSQHIVDMRLGRLTGLEREKLEAELADLRERIHYFNSILSEEAVLLQVIDEELAALRNRYQSPRRTTIDPFAEEITDESLITEETVVLTMTHFGYIKRLPAATYSMQHRGGRGITGMQTREEDFVETIITASSHDNLLFFTNTGRVFRLKAYQIPEAGRTAKGIAIVNLLQLESGEKVRNIIPIHSYEEGGYLVMATAQGNVKKTELFDYANINRRGLIAIALREGDELVGVRRTLGDRDMLLVSSAGLGIRFNEAVIRVTGRNTQGVRGMKLRNGDKVIGMMSINEEKDLMLVSELGYGKRTDYADFRTQGRGGYGVKVYRISEKTGALVGVNQLTNDHDLIIVNDVGVIIRISAEEIPTLGRNTQGVKLMRSQEGVVVDIATVQKEEQAEETEPEQAGAAETSAEETAADSTETESTVTET